MPPAAVAAAAVWTVAPTSSRSPMPGTIWMLPVTAGSKSFSSAINISALFISQAAVYRGNVLALHMSKPAGFEYKSGMYLFLQCAEISPFEW